MKNKIIEKLEELLAILVVAVLIVAALKSMSVKEADAFFWDKSPEQQMQSLLTQKLTEIREQSKQAKKLNEEVQRLEKLLQKRKSELQELNKNNDCKREQTSKATDYLQNPNPIKEKHINKIHKLGSDCMQ